MAALTSRVCRVVLVDDHPLVREGLRTLISHEPDLEVVGEAEGLGEALSVLRETRPQIAVIDISLKNGSGLELIKHIKADFPGLRVLVSSMHDEMVYAQRVLQAGAMGYVSKQEASQKIVEGIRRIKEDRIYVSDRVNDRLLARAAHSNVELERSPVSELSDRELEVFQLIGEGMATREIAEKLSLSPKTVDSHRQNIRMKLDLDSSSELTHYATQWVISEA